MDMAVRDGKFYACDSYSPAFVRGEYPVSRPYHGEKIGEFQCRDVLTGKMLWSTDAFNPGPPGGKRADSENFSIVLAGDRAIVTNVHGLWIARLLADGVKVLARVPQAVGRTGTRMLSEPVLVGGRLFVRQLDGDPKAGLLPALGGGSGNLICLDLRAR
jgi:outer membrane protein assembly factor BamB